MQCHGPWVRPCSDLAGEDLLDLDEMAQCKRPVALGGVSVHQAAMSILAEGIARDDFAVAAGSLRPAALAGEGVGDKQGCFGDLVLDGMATSRGLVVGQALKALTADEGKCGLEVGYHGGCSLEELVVPMAWLVDNGVPADERLLVVRRAGVSDRTASSHP
jgi:hypothetical protein